MILRLTLKKQWFDLILSGKKVFEYREYKKHWISRILGKNGIKNFKEIHFTNGYGKNMPFMRVSCIGISTSTAILRRNQPSCSEIRLKSS